MHSVIYRIILDHALEQMRTFLIHFSERLIETVPCRIHTQNKFSCVYMPIYLKIIAFIDKTPSRLAVTKLDVAGDFLLRLLPGDKEQVWVSTLHTSLCKEDRFTTREFRPFFFYTQVFFLKCKNRLKEQGCLPEM